MWLEVEQSSGILQTIAWWCVSSSASTPKLSNTLHRHGLDCWTRFSLLRNIRTSAWPFWMPKVGRQVESLDTEALPKFGKEGEASSLRGLYHCAVSYNPDICGTWIQTEIFRSWMGHAFSSCPDRTCRCNRLYMGKPGAARVKSPRQWCPTPQESRPPGNVEEKPVSAVQSSYVYTLPSAVDYLCPPPKFTGWNPNSQYDDVWKWGPLVGN